MKRVYLIVLDSFGIGEEPDAADFGDVGSNTLRSITKSKYFNIENLKKAGLTNIDGVDFLDNYENNTAAIARIRELSAGKDTTIGHWEIAGIISKKRMPTFPNGFPKEVIDKFEEMTGRKVLCNLPYSGTDVIRDYGEQAVKENALIVYTSADSVFQIAAHEDVVPIEELYEICRGARKMLTGDYGVGRVIARPFIGTPGNYVRTSHRHDFSLEPTGKTVLDAIKENGKDVIAIGKINDIFAGVGISEYTYTSGNTEGMEVSLKMLEKDFNGICFINLVDFDMLYGHRNDVDGYAKAISEFDNWLPTFVSKMKEDDVLIITADHGCDPGDISTDHTREYIPMLCIGNKIKPINLGTRMSFSSIAATVADFLDVKYDTVGESFAKEVLK